MVPRTSQLMLTGTFRFLLLFLSLLQLQSSLRLTPSPRRPLLPFLMITQHTRNVREPRRALAYISSLSSRHRRVLGQVVEGDGGNGGEIEESGSGGEKADDTTHSINIGTSNTTTTST